MTTEQTKRCPSCGETKPTTHFWIDRAKPDALQGWCADCYRVYRGTAPTGAPVPPRRPAVDFTQLWEDWGRWHRPADREALIVHHRALVDSVAGSMVVRLTRSADREDLAGYGVLGLIDAVDRFDPSLGVPFERYAARRIEGAILDGLRGVAWEPRSVRTRAREIAQARSRLEHAHGRSVNEAEIAAALGTSVAEVARGLTDMHTAGTTPLTEHEDAGGAAPSDESFPVDIENLRHALADAIVTLPDRERVVFALYYQEELTLGGIGEMLDVSAVRITQILNDAIGNIQERLAGR